MEQHSGCSNNNCCLVEVYAYLREISNWDVGIWIGGDVVDVGCNNAMDVGIVSECSESLSFGVCSILALIDVH